ncbi:unnamed protein product [Ranitomeya imitator]|uniref:Uncharacterized protein n=1 Tax=Ranitomeya imitator TaxID=111125 RepID=A0ABN9L9V8_9NEOB|nr:unnamed protein product [Ranitomeya imitator]
MSSETFFYNTTEVADIVSRVTASSDFVQTPPQELKNRDLERETKRAINLELHTIMIAEYLKVQRIRRGMRVPLHPTFFKEDKEYCTKFEQILNKCSFDLMTLTLSFLPKNLESVNSQITAIETQLSSTMPVEEFQEMKSKNQETLNIFRRDLEKKKRSKFLRDTEDYQQSRVYQWRDTNRFFRHRASQSSSDSIDSRHGSSNTPTNTTFLGLNRGRQRG